MSTRLIRTSALVLLILTVRPPATRPADVAPAKLLDLAKMSAFQSKKFEEAVESECNALLKGGVFNALRIRSSSDIRTAIEEWECKHEFKTHDEALASGLSVGFPVYGVPLTIGGTFTDQQRTTWKSDHCQSSKVTFSDEERYAFEQLVASPDILQAYTDCVGTTQLGLIARLRKTDDCNFVLSAKYVPNSEGDLPPKVTSFTVSGGSCAQPPKKNDKIFYAGQAYDCRRTQRETFQTILNTTKGSATKVLSGFPPLGPEPAKPKYGDVLFDRSESGAPYLYVCRVYGPGHQTGTGTCTVPDAGFVDRVEWHCTSGACGWSYHRQPSQGYNPDYVLTNGGHSIQWYRRWDGDAVWDEYHIYYKVSRNVCVENCDYDKLMKQYELDKARTCSK
jgi:hypothetical protein